MSRVGIPSGQSVGKIQSGTWDMWENSEGRLFICVLPIRYLMRTTDMNYYDDAKLVELFGDLEEKEKNYNMTAYGQKFDNLSETAALSIIEDEEGECPVIRGNTIYVGRKAVATLEAI